MMTSAATASTLSVRRLVELLSRLEDQEGPVGVALFGRSGEVTIQAASNAVICPPDPVTVEVAEPPVILIVAGDPPDGFARRVEPQDVPAAPTRPATQSPNSISPAAAKCQ